MAFNLRRFGRVLLFVVAATCAACGDDTTTTPTPTTPLRSTETFGGMIGVGGSSFYSFTVTTTGTTDITLLSLRTAGVPTATLGLPVGLGLGIPAATDCAVSTAVNATPALTTQLTLTTTPNTYCVKISDIGALFGTVDYNIRILHP